MTSTSIRVLLSRMANANEIREFQRHTRVSSRDLAKAVGVSLESLKSYRKDRRRPSAAVNARLDAIIGQADESLPWGKVLVGAGILGLLAWLSRGGNKPQGGA